MKFIFTCHQIDYLAVYLKLESQFRRLLPVVDVVICLFYWLVAVLSILLSIIYNKLLLDTCPKDLSSWKFLALLKCGHVLKPWRETSFNFLFSWLIMSCAFLKNLNLLRSFFIFYCCSRLLEFITPQTSPSINYLP